MAGKIQDADVKSSSEVTAISRLINDSKIYVSGNSINKQLSQAIVDGDIHSGTLAIAKGGTGQTTKAPAFDALSPMNAGGQLIYGGASGTGTALANGNALEMLASAGGTSAPVWTPQGIQAVATKTGSYTLTNADDVLLLDASGGAFNLTLHDPATARKKLYKFVMIGSGLNKVSILAYNLQGSLRKLCTQYESLTIYPDGSNWQVVSHYTETIDTSFTPTLTSSGGGSITLNATGKIDPSGMYKRRGNRILMQVTFKNGTGGGATGSAGNVQITYPSNITLDTGSFPTATAIGNMGGGGVGTLAGGSSFTGLLVPAMASAHFILLKPAGGASYQLSDLTASTAWSAIVEFPVTDWW